MGPQSTDFIGTNRATAEAVWNAALANTLPVQPPVQQTGRFEVGDRVEMLVGASRWESATIVASFLRDGTSHSTPFPADVRPAPQTIDLTDDEKIDAIFASRVQRMPESIPNTWKAIAHELATGKTLDQLCAQHGVETKRSV